VDMMAVLDLVVRQIVYPTTYLPHFLGPCALLSYLYAERFTEPHLKDVFPDKLWLHGTAHIGRATVLENINVTSLAYGKEQGFELSHCMGVVRPYFLAPSVLTSIYPC
jgi:hypothetical protein